MCYDYNMSDNILSDDQFSYLANEAMHTGFSVKTFGPRAGERASYGYLVGTAGHGHDISPASDITGQHVKEYALGKKPVLSQDNMYLGGWRGGNPERASLDVTKLAPSTLRGREEALTSMISANQEAAGHVMDPNDYSETSNPFYDPKATQTGRPLTAEEHAWVRGQTFPLGRRVSDLLR